MDRASPARAERGSLSEAGAADTVEPTVLTPVRWGVLGVADIAVDKVIPAMQASQLSPVTAIASRDPRRARDAAARLGIEHAHGSYESLLAAPEVDAVYIPLPNHLHSDWVIAAARAGKHVLCEKPLALTSRDARRMIDACERAGVALMEAFMYRLHPLWVAAIDRVRNGTIGEVRAIQTAFSYYNDDPTDIRNRRDAGGGALYDIGCYAVNLARMVFASEPTSIQASVRRDEIFGTDVLSTALLDFDGGHATFTCSTQLEPSQRVEIFGTTGRIVIEIPFNIPPDRETRLQIFSGGAPPTAPHVDIVDIATTDPYVVQVDAFSRALRLGEPVPVPPGDAVRNLAVIEAILEVAESAGNTARHR